MSVVIDRHRHLLERLQSQLEKLYGLDTRYSVGDFLISDGTISRLTGSDTSPGEEYVLVHQTDDELSLAVYVDGDLLQRLTTTASPFAALGLNNLHDFCVALEGVSHFLYLTWRATQRRQTTQLELELQAEVDKYLIAARLLAEQNNGCVPPDLHCSLFEEVRYRPGLDQKALNRYRDANRYAGKYCLKLGKSCAFDGHGIRTLKRELHHFYRLPQPEKIRHIDRATSLVLA